MDIPEHDRPAPKKKGKSKLPQRKESATVVSARQKYGSNPDEITTLPVPTFYEYWRLMLRRKGTLVLAAFAGVALGLIVSLPRTPVYQARTTLEIQGLNENLFNTREIDPSKSTLMTPASEEIQTQIRILQSDSLIARTMTKLSLQDAGDESFPLSGLAKLRAKIVLWRTGSEPSREAAIRMAKQNLQVQALSGAHIIQMLADSTDPEVAANFLNVLADEYIDQKLESRLKANQRTSEWLNKQLEEMRTTLQRSEKQLQVYARDSGLMFTSEKDSVAEQKLLQLQSELSGAQADRVAKQSGYETAMLASPESLPEVLDNANLRELASKLTELRSQAAELNVSLTPEHYRIQRVQAQMREIQSAFERERANVIKRMGNEYESAKRREELLTREYARQAGLVSDQSGKVTHYGLLKREVDTNRQLYEGLLQRVKEYGMASAITANNVRVIDEAQAPDLPYKPDIFMYAVLGLSTGLFLGLMLIVWQERADRSIHVPGETPLYLRVPELGVILSAYADSALTASRWKLPSLQEVVDLSKRIGNGDVQLTRYIRKTGRKSERPDVVRLAATESQFSMVAECYRTTAASILFSASEHKRQVFVVTSANPQDGKTTTSANLAVALAETKRSVLVIDADLRRPDLHRFFGVDNRWGLTDILRDDIEIGAYPSDILVQKTQVPNLHVLPCGGESGRIIHLLHSTRLPELLDRLRREFDIVIIDSPPVLQIADARVVARYSDGVVFVIHSGKTTRAMAMGACKRFKEDGARVIGTVLNKWDPRESDQHGYYGGYYEYYGSYSNKKS